MAQIIATLLDTDELEDYIDNNLDMFELDMDEDGNEIPDDVVDGIVKEIVTDTESLKRLEYMLYDMFDTWIGEQFNDMLYETIDRYVGDEVNRLLHKED